MNRKIGHTLIFLIIGVAGWSCTANQNLFNHQEIVQPHFRLLSFNVNFGLAGDLETLQAIGTSGADIIFLQETNSDWQVAIEEKYKFRYAVRRFRHCCNAGGLAVLSRFEIIEQEYLKNSVGWFPAWRVVLRTPLGPVQFLNVHLRPPFSDSGSLLIGYFSTPAIRRKEIQEFYKRLKPIPTIILGDFNETPGGKVGAFLEKQKFHSALMKLKHADDTWHWTVLGITLEDRIDYIYHSYELNPVIGGVVYEGRSDHWPIEAVFIRSPE